MVKDSHQKTLDALLHVQHYQRYEGKVGKMLGKVNLSRKRGFEIFLIDHYFGDSGNNNIAGKY